MWEGVGDRTELKHIDIHSYGHNSVSFPFSWAAQPGAGCWFFPAASYCQLVWSPTDWISCALSYIIVQRPPSSCWRHKSLSFNPSTVKVIISWYSSTGCTCYLPQVRFTFLTARPGRRSICNKSNRSLYSTSRVYFYNHFIPICCIQLPCDIFFFFINTYFSGVYW